MNTLLTVDNNGQPVVSSRQLADNFGKDHGNVLKAINAISKDVVNFNAMFFESTMDDSYGRPQKVYLMNRDGFTLLAMGFTGKPALQWKLKYIAAFNEMEKKLSNTIALPRTYLEALESLVSKEKALVLAESKVLTLEPKAKAFDLFIDSTGYHSMGTTAKMLGTGRNRLFGLLWELDILMTGNVPYQKYVEHGYFAVKAGITYVSPKGLQWLSQKLCIGVSTNVNYA